MLVIRPVFLFFLVFGMAMTSARAEEQVVPGTATEAAAMQTVSEIDPEAADVDLGSAKVADTIEGAGSEENEAATSDVFPPIVRAPVIQGYDSRCWPIAARMATEPDALMVVELDLLQDCIAQLRAGVAVGDRPETGFLSAYCETQAPACPPPPPPVVCPPPAKPNLERLCPRFMDEQRQRRIDDRGPVRARPHLPGG